MADGTIPQAFDAALQHHQAGRLGDAELLYRQILKMDPRHVGSMHNLGLIAFAVRQFPIAIDLLRRAIALVPQWPEAHNNLGNALCEVGMSEDAITCYRHAISLRPDYAEAHSNLGAVLKDKGRLETAIESYRRAIELRPDLSEAHYNLGDALTLVGKLEGAVVAYRQAVRFKPDYAEAYNNLAHALQKQGRIDEALLAVRRALQIQPGLVQGHCNLGNLLLEQNKLDEAIKAYRHALGFRPDYPDAHFSLGNALLTRGDLDEAIAAFQRAVSVRPDYSEAYNNLGNALTAKGNLTDAVAAYRQAIVLNPTLAEAHNNLGNALREKHETDGAMQSFRNAIEIGTAHPQAYHNLGNLLREEGQLDKAIEAYRQAIEDGNALPETHFHLGSLLKEQGKYEAAVMAYVGAISRRPHYPEALNNLASTLTDLGRLDEAIDACRRAIALKPNLYEAVCNLGTALIRAGQFNSGAAAFREAMLLNPTNPTAHSSLIYSMIFQPAYTAQAIARELHQWNIQHAEPLRRFIHSAETALPSAGRRLKVGYISPDFKQHVVGYNLLPLFRNHDRSQFEIFCYSNVRLPDPYTERFEELSDHWRNIAVLSDQHAADLIHADHIDILVDLSLHMAGNRLLVLGRKPAPVQVTFAGYPGSTGMTAIDYRLTDPYLDPPGMDESIYSERTFRLPHSFWCYDPADVGDVPVNPLPARDGTPITFGCLNSFSKINDPILELWAKVMQKIDGSRLLLLGSPGRHWQAALDSLGRHGIDSHRIEQVPFQSRKAYLATYNRIDIGLDSFPYNGHTTSLDSFWMGVPVVTLAGPREVSRAGWCQLSNLALSELAGETPEQFVEIAVSLAEDLPRLALLRSTLRQRMERCPLMDTTSFARGIESAYRQMWSQWCEAAADKTND